MGRRRWFGSERREGGCFVVADQRRAQVDGKACNCEALNGKAQIDLGAREVDSNVDPVQQRTQGAGVSFQGGSARGEEAGSNCNAETEQHTQAQRCASNVSAQWWNDRRRINRLS
jgi:hypothetical protein